MRNLFDWYDNWPNYAKKSLGLLNGIITVVSTVLGVCGLSIRDFFEGLWWVYLMLIVIITYAVLYFIIYHILKRVYKSTYSTNINSNELRIMVGNIFENEGMKLIPFTDTFETQADDVIISRRSLNGIYLTNYVDDLEKLRQVINDNLENGQLHGAPRADGRKRRLPLGSIISYEDYLLLAFSTLNERNEAHISRGDYEKCLYNMWASIRTKYNGRPVNIPLVGGGITTFDSAISKDPTDLLKCILCTFRASGVQLNQPVNIVLTESDFRKIDMDRIRGEF